MSMKLNMSLNINLNRNQHNKMNRVFNKVFNKDFFRRVALFFVLGAFGIMGTLTNSLVHASTDTEQARMAVEKMVEALTNADADLFVQVVEVDPAEKIPMELSEVAAKLKPGLLAIQGHHLQSGGIQRVSITDETVVDANTIKMKKQLFFKNGKSEPAELTTVVRKADGWKVRIFAP